MRVAALGVSGLKVTDQASAKAAITTIDDAIRAVSGERSNSVLTRTDLSTQSTTWEHL